MVKKHFWWVLCVLVLLSVTAISWRPAAANNTVEIKKAKSKATEAFEQYVSTIYQTANLQQAGLDAGVFQKALTGFFNLKLANKLPQTSQIITVVDFNK